MQLTDFLFLQSVYIIALVAIFSTLFYTPLPWVSRILHQTYSDQYLLLQDGILIRSSRPHCPAFLRLSSSQHYTVKPVLHRAHHTNQQIQNKTDFSIHNKSIFSTPNTTYLPIDRETYPQSFRFRLSSSNHSRFLEVSNPSFFPSTPEVCLQPVRVQPEGKAQQERIYCRFCSS